MATWKVQYLWRKVTDLSVRQSLMCWGSLLALVWGYMRHRLHQEEEEEEEQEDVEEQE